MKKVLAAIAVCSPSLWAQSPESPKQIDSQRPMTFAFAGNGPQFGPIGIQAAMAGPAATIAGAPYSAEAVTERVQTLLDGNRIVQTTSSNVARDSRGRVRRDESLAILPPGEKGDPPKLEMIDDPVAGVHWTLDAHAKTATKMLLPKNGSALFNNVLPPPSPGTQKTWFYSSGTPGGPHLNVRTLTKQKTDDEGDAKTADLGTQTIEGVPAKGSRTTRTLPAGAVGNEQPLVITTETWYSPDLQVLVMSKAEDPRMGTTTYRLTNIQRAEPSASLFEVPSDYKVKDQPTNTFFYRELKKEE